MKKTWICLTTLLLLLIPSVAMAQDTIECPNCGSNSVVISGYIYYDDSLHFEGGVCDECHNQALFPSAHTESRAATCQSPAYCGDCQSNYGSKAGHNWSA